MASSTCIGTRTRALLRGPTRRRRSQHARRGRGCVRAPAVWVTAGPYRLAKWDASAQNGTRSGALGARGCGRRCDLRRQGLQLVQDAADDEALGAVATQQRVDAAGGPHVGERDQADAPAAAERVARSSAMPWPAATSASVTWKSLTRWTMRGAAPDARPDLEHQRRDREPVAHRDPRRRRQVGGWTEARDGERVVERHRHVEGLAQQRDHPDARPCGRVLGPVGDDDVDPVGQRGEVLLGDVLVRGLEGDAVEPADPGQEPGQEQLRRRSGTQTRARSLRTLQEASQAACARSRATATSTRGHRERLARGGQPQPAPDPLGERRRRPPAAARRPAARPPTASGAAPRPPRSHRPATRWCAASPALGRPCSNATSSDKNLSLVLEPARPNDSAHDDPGPPARRAGRRGAGA